RRHAETGGRGNQRLHAAAGAGQVPSAQWLPWDCAGPLSRSGYPGAGRGQLARNVNWKYPAPGFRRPRRPPARAFRAALPRSLRVIKDTMSLAGLLPVIAEDHQLQHALSQGDTDADLIAPPALRPFLVGALATAPAADKPRFVLAVTATAREAEDLTSALEAFLPAGTVACFPAWETLPHERLSPRSDTSGRRLAVLRRLAHPDLDSSRTGPISVLVSPVRSLLQPMVSGLGELTPVALRSGQDAGFEEVIDRLVEIGYARTDLVTRRGEIAVRGGLLDVFPPTEEHPLRVEFWGDSVEEIRYFGVADQRSLHAAADGLWAPPCRELLLTPAVRERARQ